MSNEITIAVKGSIRGKENRRQLMKVLHAKLGAGFLIVNLDMDEAGTPDFGALTDLLAYRKSLVNEGTKLRILHCPQAVIRLLQAFRVNDLLDELMFRLWH